jgi:hypothetical protein
MSAARGAVEHLTRVLKARVLKAAKMMSAMAQPALAPSAAVELLVASGTLTQLTTAECQPDRVGPSAETGIEAGTSGPHRPLTDLIAIARVDRMLCDALGSSCRRFDGKGVIDWPLSFTDIVISTIHSRLNGAYVYANHAYAHETLTIAAVIGHLVQGREAYINRTIAGCLVDAVPAYVDLTGGGPYATLWHYADIACGCDQLLTLAKRVLASDRSEIAKPRTAFLNRGSKHPGTDEIVAQRICDAGILTSSMVI